ncbi:hypothetical protein MMC26_005573 [Xylographa opegraphella]|nr:hypothetical protein [Xylographa opegraphella]
MSGLPVMAIEPLTIRNLSSTPIELKILERFGAPAAADSAVGVSYITKNITSLWRIPNSSSSSAPPTPAQLAEHADVFTHDDVSIRVDAFATIKTDIRPPKVSARETLRLTFENDGERYRLDIPCSTYSSTTLTPLTPNPRFNYTAVYHTQQSHLTLFSSANLQAWMRELKDETPLSALSIPGTHNSPACHRALPSVRCQAVSPQVQLENGVRFFDIRVQPGSPQDTSKDSLVLVHSVFPIALTGSKYFGDLVNRIYDFLDRNPSETVVMSLKREGTGNSTDAQLSRILKTHYAGDTDRWYTAPHIPTLGEARRKIILLRRFGLDESLKQEWNGAGWGINAETWADNTPNGTCPSGDICVQDFYEVLDTENIDKKITYCEDQLDRSAACVCALPTMGAGGPSGRQPIYLNFLSASNFWNVGCWPERIAAKLNPAIVDYLCRKHNSSDQGKKVGDGCTGIVVCDWVGNNGNWDLVRCIVGMNAKLELREKMPLSR